MPGNDKKRAEKGLMQRREDSPKMEARIREKEQMVNSDTTRSVENIAGFVLCFEKSGD